MGSELMSVGGAVLGFVWGADTLWTVVSFLPLGFIQLICPTSEEVVVNAGSLVLQSVNCRAVLLLSSSFPFQGLLPYGLLVTEWSVVDHKSRGILDYVKCSGDEASLWHCMAQYKAQPFECTNIVSVSCGASVSVRLADGPGKCAGRLEIKLKGQWNRVERTKWTDSDSNVVCNELKCGNARTDETLDKLCQGSLPFLEMTVKCEGSQKMSSCTMKQWKPRPNELRTTTTIVCEVCPPVTSADHLEVFLKGSRWCEGQVEVQHHSNPYWLSGAAATWNTTAANIVCRQMHCGNAESHTYNLSLSTGGNVWGKEYKCSSKEESLFDCPSSNNTDNSTIAFVKCADNIELRLKDRCWGTVEVCVNHTCGGVCRDSWSDNNAKEVCRSQPGCGDYVPLDKHKLPEELLTKDRLSVTLKSLHFKPSGKSLLMYSQGSEYCKDGPAAVVCSDSDQSNSTRTALNQRRHL
ncbi:Deleted in malignant brain tumors 1 protein [Merluccius polli]|uniref:Deleted in malignant brain tumors 1 protein n=1 Tax=Merluccius polli TaxID=89951 RepID=A0AA47NS35_MERPO|nr:Deleted in malignant brain tumors 1 protein [Merluccius polli]